MGNGQVEYTYNKEQLNPWLFHVGYNDGHNYIGLSVPINHSRDREIWQFTGTFTRSADDTEYSFLCTQYTDGEVLDVRLKNRGGNETNDDARTEAMMGNVIDHIRRREGIVALLPPKTQQYEPALPPTRFANLTQKVRNLLGTKP